MSVPEAWQADDEQRECELERERQQELEVHELERERAQNWQRELEEF